MSPVIFGQSVPSMLVIGIGLIVFITILLLSIWYFFKDQLSNEIIFDISLLTIISTIIVSRIVYIISNYNQNTSLLFAMSPITEDELGTRYLEAMPWTLLKVYHGDLNFIGIIFAITIIILILYKNRAINKIYYLFIDKYILTVLMSMMILLISLFIASDGNADITNSILGIYFIDGLKKYPVYAFRIIIFSLLLLLYLYSSTRFKAGFFGLFSLLIISLAEIVLLINTIISNDYNIFTTYINYIIAVIICTVAIYLYLKIPSDHIHQERVLRNDLVRLQNNKEYRTKDAKSLFNPSNNNLISKINIFSKKSR
jgi:hypothetical protein